ncbi:hypothetical protein BGZ91_011082 [Linnemannia elongata]|nr:hypothetical protein BGZ91_011082 [Linnemannia elongata]KAG0080525.1 hypothetical protein BGZ90_012011 [Linnemannia elongata]
MATPLEKEHLVNGITALARHIQDLESEELRLLSIFLIPKAPGKYFFDATLKRQNERDMLTTVRQKICDTAVEHSKLNIILRQYDDHLGTTLNQGVWNTMLKRKVQLDHEEIAYLDSCDALQAELKHNVENTRLVLGMVTAFLEHDPYKYLVRN